MPTEAFASPLIVWFGPHRYTFPVGRDVTIGRDNRADIRLDGAGPPLRPPMSVLHHNGRQWIAVDRSEDGIYVDGVRMSTVFIHDGRAITLGDPAARAPVGLPTRRPATPATKVSATPAAQRCTAPTAAAHATAPTTRCASPTRPPSLAAGCAPPTAVRSAQTIAGPASSRPADAAGTSTGRPCGKATAADSSDSPARTAATTTGTTTSGRLAHLAGSGPTSLAALGADGASSVAT